MKPKIDSEAAETVRTKEIPAVASSVTCFARCSTCKHFGGQGIIGLRSEEGQWRYCSLFLFGDFERETDPMPDYRVTWGNSNGAKGQLFVHEQFGCVNHNPEFEQ